MPPSNLTIHLLYVLCNVLLNKQIAEAIPALGWVSVPNTPVPYVKEMSDAAALYTNRILKEFKDK